MNNYGEKMDYLSLKKRIDESGISYSEYIKRTELEISSTQREYLTTQELKRLNIKSLNLQRGSRIRRTYNPGEELNRLLNEISLKQLWLVITENWCGDSGQNLPYIAVMASQNSLIDLKIILRDPNPDIMDEFLTKGTKSIPILAVFSQDGEELFRWGPRPAFAVNLITKWKSDGLEKPEWTEKLHSWYAKDKGCELEKEFIDLISKAVLTH
jgi:hypothetical protein